MKMKSTFVGFAGGLALLALSSQGLGAQTVLGVRGGASVSQATLDFQENFSRENRTGFAGGVFLDFGGSSLLGFQLGAQYVQKGVDLDLGQTVEELNLDYLEIPAVVKAGLPLGVLKPSVFGGVGMGFNTGCELGGENCDSDVSSIEWSGIIGADLALYMGGISLWADGRYHVGINDLADSESFSDLKNRAWTFQAGIGLPLGR